MRFLRRRLNRSEVVDPSRQTNRSSVYFGVTVTYAEEDGTEKTVTIVGIDEADRGEGKISWVSPVARALLKAEIGDGVAIECPAA